MQAVDKEVFDKVLEWLTAGKSCWLATVVATWGSSPRPVGSLLACNAQGHMVGSLSGGCVEDDLLEKLTNGEIAADKAQFFEYGISAAETERLGLPCGGHLSIIVEPVPANDQTVDQSINPSITEFQLLCQTLEQRKCVRRTVNLVTQQTQVTPVESHQALIWNELDQILTQTYGPQFQLFIIGAGMVGKYLAQMAQLLDYEVTVCDPRKEMLDQFEVAGTRLINDMPDDAVRNHAQDRATAIVALTHDPRIDDMGLMEALTTDAFYIGALGSKKTSSSRRERLKALDLTDAQINQLHAPIGLPIGSKTPPEIAIAILAEITAVRKLQTSQVHDHLNKVSAG